MVAGRKGVDEYRPWQLLSRAQIEASPSFKLGMSFKAEKKLREAACKVIGEAGKTLDQGIITIATAQTYLMRFFAIKPYQKNDSFIVAVAALFVASKTENKPRALIDIAHACWRHWIDLWAKEQKKRRKDQPPSYWDQKAQAEKAMFRSPEFSKRLTEAATTAERVLLYTTGFQFNVPTAFFILAGCKHRLQKHEDAAVARFFDELDLQIVWNFVVESYCSTRQCLEFDPRTIGIACYEMTCAHLHREIPLVGGDVWWKYVAEKMEWEAGLAKPEEVLKIQEELWKIFTPSGAKGKGGSQTNGFHPPSEGPRSQPTTPLLPAVQQSGWATPSASRPSSAQPTMQRALPGAAGNGHAAQTVASQLSAALPAPLSLNRSASDAHATATRAPTAQVKQKEGAGSVHFSPSDEFAASPRGSAPDDSAQTSQPRLLGPENGELPLEDVLSQQASAADKQKARLAKVRAAMLEKRKTEGGPSTESEAKRKKSPELGLQFEP